MPTDLAVPGLHLLSIAIAVVGGVFLTFSDFVMRSLAAAERNAGIQSMQLINRKVYRSVFIVLLIGLVPASIVMAALVAINAGTQASIFAMAGAITYTFGVMGVTAAGNVPMNKRLDAMTLNVPKTLGYWSTYLARWTALNTVRVIASIASAALFSIGAQAL
ncbi:hypothetical protein GCM10007989_03330 [Devosia pacifica]|uniref:DUF1772 domain-containing protein n=1 Tax=Devosia pacifica TaxID=1335967 RepID=A0A918RWM8_9HYPH|nr:anthrone oxygenase family protein [Devosia pacifica]GHA12225.1 hypothetical protein GCM10007989_03330 [Devosia pacifica]